jgi:transposase
LAAAVAQLTGGTKTSRRDAQAFVENVFGIPMSLGSVSNLEAEVSESLVEPYTEVAEAVRLANGKNVDETGWKVAGQKAWLWTAATPVVAFFVITAGRGKDGFRTLLDRVCGFITSDRWHVYAEVKNRWRQVCWSHLKRDFKRLAGKKGEAGVIGEQLLLLTHYVFTLWHDFKRGNIDRRTLNQCLRSIKVELRELLQQGVELDMVKVSIFCQNLLDLEPALWNFAIHDGLEPTNNHAERVLRYAVIWRKISFGANSERGCRYVERMLTTVQSCRLQGRSTYRFIANALAAHRTGAPPPSLLPTSA